MKKVLNILLIALILTILWILFLVIKSSSSNVQGVKSVKTEYDNYYAEIDKKIKKEFNMSKAAFKRAIGRLYKERIIVIEKNGIKIVN